ncbi:MAG: PEP-utilizing enzyme [Patescibacteria group bacterium]
MVLLWRKNFEIKRVDLNIMAESQHGFYDLQNKTIDKKVLKSCLWIIKNLDNVASYFLKDELRAIIKNTLYVIINKPNKVDKIHQDTIDLNKKYFKFAKSIRKLKLSNLSNKKLLLWHNQLFRYQYLSHGLALPTTWFIDSDGEDFTKYLRQLLQRKITPKSNINMASAFSLLTTPLRQSLGQQEEIESLKILGVIKRNKKVKNWFISNTTSELLKQFSTLAVNIKKQLYNHFQKWCWMPYTYLGPAYTLDYYLEIWRGLLHEDINPDAEIKKIHIKILNIRRNHKAIVKKLKLSNQEKHLFNIAADIIWLKGYRKDCYYHGFFVLDLILAEIARRSGLSLLQTKYLLHKELPKALKGKDFSKLTNERMKFSVIYFNKRRQKVLIGKRASKFLSRQKFERIPKIKASDLNGTCACPGFAKGIARVVNVPEDIPKMKPGDIMISHTTFPALVPAMKKAAAIVTEDGGVTCHAAIVARELQTPCIVGCKGLLKVLKDANRIEVNASEGIIKKL